MVKRHRWVKIRVHCYICRDCGTGRVNAQQRNGDWITTWHRPNGESVVSAHVPTCEVGPRTGLYLEHYSFSIQQHAAAGDPRRI
jgi:hypothetical protein